MRPNRAAPRLAGRGETRAHMGAPLTRHELAEASPRQPDPRGGGGVYLSIYLSISIYLEYLSGLAAWELSLDGTPLACDSLQTVCQTWHNCYQSTVSLLFAG